MVMVGLTIQFKTFLYLSKLHSMHRMSLVLVVCTAPPPPPLLPMKNPGYGPESLLYLHTLAKRRHDELLHITNTRWGEEEGREYQPYEINVSFSQINAIKVTSTYQCLCQLSCICQHSYPLVKFLLNFLQRFTIP